MDTAHYSDVITSAVASQITSVSIVYSPVCSGLDQREHQSSASLAFVREIHRWPAQRVSNAENVSILWRHHGKGGTQQNSIPAIVSDQVVDWNIMTMH